MTVTKSSYLRDMVEADLSTVFRWRNDPSIRAWMYSRSPIRWDEHTEWFARVSADPTRHVKILVREGRECAFVQFEMDNVSKNSVWGFYVAPDAEPGTGRCMGKLALQFAFHELGVHKISGEALANNHRSIRFHERLGFSKEGCRRKQYFDGVRYHDVCLFGLLSSEYLNN